MATDPAGMVIARTDRPAAQGEDLSKDPMVMKPLEGEESATVWRQGDKLFHAVVGADATGADLEGVLVAGYGINEALASDIRKLTHSEIAFLTTAAGPAAAALGLVARAQGGRARAPRSAGPSSARRATAPFERRPRRRALRRRRRSR